MGHEVEAGHEEDKIAQHLPVVPKRYSSFRDECLADVAASGAYTLSLDEALGLRQAETEGNEEDRRASAEPEERAPTVLGSVDQATGKGYCQEIAKRITLLKNTTTRHQLLASD